MSFLQGFRTPILAVIATCILFFGFSMLAAPLSAQENNAARKAAKAASKGQLIPYIVQDGDSLWSLSERFETPIQTIRKINLLSAERGIFPGQIILIPKRPNRPASATLNFVSLPPVDSSDPTSTLSAGLKPPIGPGNIFISQGYHAAHHGLDFSVQTGTPVLTVAHGEVIHIEENHPIYGQMLIVDHGNDIISLYAHLSEISVRVGYIVLQGEVLGLSGNTGRSTRPHLHFELREAGIFINPCLYIASVCE